MKSIFRYLFLALVSSMTLCATAQTVQLVKDINPYFSTGSAYTISDAFPAGDSIYLVARTQLDGYELWLFDGDSTHFKLIKSLGTGGQNANIMGLHSLGGKSVFVQGDFGIHTLWSTDGTVAGTVKLLDFDPGALFVKMLKFGNRVLVFLNGSVGVSNQVWSSDGTVSGTVLLGTYGSLRAENIAEMGGELYFADVNQLYKTTGLPGGTTVILPTNTLYSLDGLQVMQGRLWFTAIDFTHGRELWSCDGTLSGLAMHDDYNPGSGDGAYGYAPMAVTAGWLYYVCNDGNAVHGEELRRTDGNASTAVVYDYTPGPVGSDYWSVVAAESYAVFQELTTSNYLLANANSLVDFDTTHHIGVSNTMHLVSGDTIVFKNAISGTEILLTDGTWAGTRLIDSVHNYYPSAIADWRDSLFLANDALPLNSSEILLYDWSLDTLRRLWQLPLDVLSSRPMQLSKVGGDVLFMADDGLIGAELWRSDGTTAGTTLVKDIHPTASSVYNTASKVVGGKLFFNANDGTVGEELWISDGTASGTHLVKDVRPGPLGAAPSSLFPIDNVLYFSALDSVTPRALYRSDGTAQGTWKVHDFHAAPYLTGTGFAWARLGNHLLAQWWGVPGSNLRYGLYLTDGQPGVFMPLARFESAPTSPVYFAGKLYFQAKDSAGISQIWSTGGTPASTQRMTAFTTANQGAPLLLGAVQGKLLLSMTTTATGRELYASDGTWAGTNMLPEIRPGSVDGFVDDVAIGDSIAYFLGSTAGYGEELWRTDGTASGTIRLTNLPGVQSGFSGPMMDGDRLYALASLNQEPWEVIESDGTLAGTTYFDIWPGFFSSSPKFLAITDQGCLLTANQEDVGNSFFLLDQGVLSQMADPTGDPQSIRVTEVAPIAGGILLSMNHPHWGEELFRIDGLDILNHAAPDVPIAIQSQSLRAYPVPTSGPLHVSAIDDGDMLLAVEVLSPAGAILRQQVVDSLQDCIVDLGGLPAGLYLLRAQLSSGTWQSLKVVKI